MRHRRQLRALVRGGVRLCVSSHAGAVRAALRGVVSTERRLRAAESLGERLSADECVAAGSEGAADDRPREGFGLL